MADVVAICICCVRSFDAMWQMLLPLWLMLLPFISCFVWQMLTIKEALYIRVNSPSLNKNIGKYHLPHIWDEVLCNSTELKLK